ncbi:MAG: hypothetical protein Q7V02_08260 [Methylophilus sp.]|nr:hypothetical protein [Methylophilus sp.]
MQIKVLFSDVESKVTDAPGLYEIYTNSGVALKVGISSNLRKRLIQHSESKQHYLFCPSGDWSVPKNVTSKRSILAKHLYFLSAHGYDLKLESERQRFLKKECYILLRPTKTQAEARELEKVQESTDKFWFVGSAMVRSLNDR